MVIPVGPGKFYGSSLPRPRYFTNVTLNAERVDPPLPVLDPLLSWANEAHWSMGGLSFKRLRLQGRIEGNINKLRVEREKTAKKHHLSAADDALDFEFETKSGISKKRAASVSPPPAPMVSKRRRFMALLDEDEDEIEEEAVEVVKKGNGSSANLKDRRKPVRKLGDDFDRVASESSAGESERTNGSVPSKVSTQTRTRSRRSEPDSVDDIVMKVVQEVEGKTQRSGKKGKSSVPANSSPASSTRSSPRLTKRGST